MTTMHGAFRFEIKIMFVNDDGDIAWVTATFGFPGTIPTEEAVSRLVAQCLDSLPDGFRMANKVEFFSELINEKTGTEGETWAPDGEPHFEPFPSGLTLPTRREAST